MSEIIDREVERFRYCELCGESGLNTQKLVDHGEGGPDTAPRLVKACLKCGAMHRGAYLAWLAQWSNKHPVRYRLGVVPAQTEKVVKETDREFRERVKKERDEQKKKD